MEKNKLCVILFGLAGSGKGTQSAFIEKNFNAVTISPGDLLREKIKSGSLSPDVVKEIQKGNLADPVFVANLVVGEFKEFLLKDQVDVIALDGFPRSLEQDGYFRAAIDKSQKLLALYFKISEKELLARLSERFYCIKCNAIYNKSSKPTKVDGVCDVCGGIEFTSRVDDADVGAVKKRIEVFEAETFLVVEKYKKEGLLQVFDASMEPTKISEEVKAAILKRLS